MWTPTSCIATPGLHTYYDSFSTETFRSMSEVIQKEAHMKPLPPPEAPISEYLLIGMTQGVENAKINSSAIGSSRPQQSIRVVTKL